VKFEVIRAVYMRIGFSGSKVVQSGSVSEESAASIFRMEYGGSRFFRNFVKYLLDYKEIHFTR
jgi:hypothetical protein